MTEQELREQLVHAYAMQECESSNRNAQHFFECGCITEEERDLFVDVDRRRLICPYERYWGTLARHLKFSWECDHPAPKGQQWTFTTSKPIQLVLS